MTTHDMLVGIPRLFCRSSSVATTSCDAGSVGDSEGSALRRALARAGSACLDAKESIGPKGRRGRGGAAGAPPRPRAPSEAIACQTAAIGVSSFLDA